MEGEDYQLVVEAENNLLSAEEESGDLRLAVTAAVQALHSLYSAVEAEQNREMEEVGQVLMRLCLVVEVAQAHDLEVEEELMFGVGR